MIESAMMIHVRFAPDARVVDIGSCPAGTEPQVWFDFLRDRAGSQYQPLAGGRGLFRLSPEQLAALQTSCEGQEG